MPSTLEWNRERLEGGMKTFLIGVIAGTAIGAAGAYVVENSGVHHQVQIYKDPPAMTATAGLQPLSAEATRRVMSPPKSAAKPPAQAAAPVQPKPTAPSPQAAAPAAPAQPKPAAPQTAAAPAAGDAALGAKVFNKCKACHTLETGGADRVGPNLHGVFGRKAGAKQGFKFSGAMTGSTIVWDDKVLDQYLANPKNVVPGGRMAFPGLPDAKERSAVIEYLRQNTK
jgi:cytochrome c